MDIVLLVKSFLGLIVLLAILISFLFYMPKKRVLKEKKQEPQESEKSEYLSLEKLVDIIRDRSSTTKELQSALERIIKYYGTLSPKLGLRPHPDFDIYGEVLLRICRHPNTNKDIILNFDRALEAKNEEYKKEINDFLTKGLNSRGV